MVWQPVRIALLFGAVAAVAVSSARADCCTPAPCAPTMKTIQVTECVPETYTTTRTAYRVECKQEAYTAYKTQCVPETRTRVCTVYKHVPEVRTEVRNVCVQVPVVEERTVMQRHWENQTVTTMVCKTVDRGHWECKEVPCYRKQLANWLHTCCHRHDCCDACEPCCPPATRTVKCWVPCKVTEQCPVTTCKKVCVEVPCKVKVTVCKTVVHQEKFQVCCYKCVPEQRTETYTVNISRCVPFQATRTVRVCVPFQETVTCTRMVARTVSRQVPVECAPAPCCHSTPCSPCCNSTPRSTCCDSCGHRCHRLSFAGLLHRQHGCGCGCE